MSQSSAAALDFSGELEEFLAPAGDRTAERGNSPDNMIHTAGIH